MFSKQAGQAVRPTTAPRFLSRLPPLPEKKREVRALCPPPDTPNPLLLPAAEGVARWMHPRVCTFAAGELWAVTLDRACSILGAYRLTRTPLAPVPGLTAHLLRLCDADSACRIVLVHKDTGAPGSVSGGALTLTTHLCALCKTIGVDILDQLIFDSRTKYTSLRKRGFFDPHRWCWKGSIYPTTSDLERHRLRNERMAHVRHRAVRSPKQPAPPVTAPPSPQPIAPQAASWVRARLKDARAGELWVVVVDHDDCICGAFRAAAPDDTAMPAVLAGILVRTKHLGSHRVLLVQALPSSAPSGALPQWTCALLQAAPSIGLQVIDHVIVCPEQDGCLVSR